MSNKKKRNKTYTGPDAKVSQTPAVHKYTAVERSKLSEWYQPRKTIIKRIAVYGGGGLVVIVLLFEAIRSLF